MNFSPEWVGFLAALFTTAAYIPQTLKIARSRDTRSLSLGMYILINIGIFGWLIYGLMLASPSLIAANAISLAMTGFILYMKIKHK